MTYHFISFPHITLHIVSLSCCFSFFLIINSLLPPFWNSYSVFLISTKWRCMKWAITLLISSVFYASKSITGNILTSLRTLGISVIEIYNISTKNFYLQKIVAFSSSIAYNKTNRTPRTSHFSDVSHGETFFIGSFTMDQQTSADKSAIISTKKPTTYKQQIAFDVLQI